MATLEELRAEHARAETRATELRRGIVRATSWEQLFSTPEEAQADFQRNLVDAWRFYYGKDDPKVQYTVEPDSDGDIHRVVREIGSDTTYQRLLSGDVVLTIYSPDRPPSVSLITPGVGNIDHRFAEADLISTDWEAFGALRLAMLFSHLGGKPATQGWEDNMLYNGYVPQRIGHRLFPGYALDKLAELREKHPHLVLKS